MIGYEYEFLVREGDIPLTKGTFLTFHEEAPLKGRVARRQNPAQELLGIWRKEGLAGIWKERDY